MTTFKAIVGFTALMALLTTPARVKGVDPDPYPVVVVTKLNSIESKVDRLEKKVDTLLNKGVSVKSTDCGCGGSGVCVECKGNCQCAKVNTVKKVETPPAPVVTYYVPQTTTYSQTTTAKSWVTGQGHTHTCPRCRTTWDHGANPSHNCPNCGATQYVQDSGVSTYNYNVQQTYTPKFTLLPRVRGLVGGCASGQCGR